MNNLTLDAANFSEQLGIYDFFNIIVSDTIFTFGVCFLYKNLAYYLWRNITIARGLALVAIIYLVGLVLQEISALTDKHIMKVQSGARYNFLKSSIDKETEISPITWLYRKLKKAFQLALEKLKKVFPPEAERQSPYSCPLVRWFSVILHTLAVPKTNVKPNSIVHNSLLLAHYRKLAENLLQEFDKTDEHNPSSKDTPDSEQPDLLDEDYVSSYMYSVCQYYVASSGKDKKVEKLRALFGMSRSLTVAFFFWCSV